MAIKKKSEDFKVNILGEIWCIKFRTPIFSSSMEQACGLCDHPAKTIWVDSELDEQTKVITVLHELFHAYTRRSGIYNGMLSFDMEEIISDQFATVLAENFDFKI